METTPKNKFLLNVNTRTIHNYASKDQRCRISQMQECNKIVFESYFEAKQYLPLGKKSASPCSFCLGAKYESDHEKSEEKNNGRKDYN